MLGASIGPGIVVPLLLLAVVVPVVLTVARRRLRGTADEVAEPNGSRLTSSALRALGPPWRVVPEIPPGALGGIDHVLVGPPGVFAVTTTMASRGRLDPGGATARAADAAIARARLDDALVPAGAPRTSSVVLHWGPVADTALDAGWSADTPAVVHVDGRRVLDWVASLDGDVAIDAGRVDAAWAAVTTAIGRPDPRR